MIKIQYEDEVFNLPSSWFEVSLGQLMVLNSIDSSLFTDDLKFQMAIIDSVSDMSDDILLKIPMRDLVVLTDLLKWINILPTSNTGVSSIIIDGIKYLPIDLNYISSGEFISLEVFQKGDVNKNLHLIASILVRPEVNGKISPLGDMIDIQNRANLFKEKLMIGDYWPLVNNFFIGADNSSLKNMQGFLGNQKVQSKLRIINS